MLLQIYGLATQPTWWHLNRVPPGGGADLQDVLAKTLSSAQPLEFFIDNMPLATTDAADLNQYWANGIGRIVAKPMGSRHRQAPVTGLYLVTTAGPDSGRSFPLTRRNLTVGRGASRAQVRDPWLSAHEFDIRLSSNGTVVTPIDEPEFLWESGELYEAGATQFQLQRGTRSSLTVPKYPGPFEIQPGQPPSPPNVVLQVIGAAAPLLIGVVLVVVTGMWYFLLFSGISVIIAAVMITQYRRARNRFVAKVRAALTTTANQFQRCVFSPHQVTSALSWEADDPFSLWGPQPDHPVLHLGSGLRKASMADIQDAQRWDAYLTQRVAIVILLRPGERTIIVGNPGLLRPLKNWCLAQLNRHAKATGTKMSIDGKTTVQAPIVVVGDEIDPTTDLAQLVFTDRTGELPDDRTTVICLQSQTVEGSVTATRLEPLGISTSTLRRFNHELGMDQPDDALSMQYLGLSATTMQGNAVDELISVIGAGSLGLSMDLVEDGPHILVTGTTGSGKSELLLTVLVGLIERYPPTEVSMILLDFKGGSSFNILAQLPHTMSVETNHIASTSFRSLGAIAAELHRRELLFAKRGVSDYRSFRKAFPDEVLPRLAVAIDEMRVLVDENPDAAQALARLAATGRSLGFHLVVATQRTQGAVSADIRANIGSIISLRTATEHDSWEALGTADAFRISPATPGRAYFKAGADKPKLFQTSRYMLDSEPVVVLPDNTDISDKLSLTTNWTALTKELERKAADLPTAEPVILPPLPTRVEGSALGTAYVLEDGFKAIGLVDEPASCAQYPLVLGQKSSRTDIAVLPNSVAWVGAADSGIEIAAERVTNYVLRQPGKTVFLDGGQLPGDGSHWDKYLHHAAATSDSLQQLIQWLDSVLANQEPTTVVITDWGSWSLQPVTGNFQGFEDLLIQLHRQYALVLKLYIFGSRELAGGRTIAMIPDRLYLPKNSSIEHRMIWPKLIAVPPVEGRAILVTAEHPTGGLAVQLTHGAA